MVDKRQQIEMIGKVFVVTCGIRRCLICDSVFTPKQAAEHSATICVPAITEAETDEGTLDPCSPFLPPIDSSSSQGQA